MKGNPYREFGGERAHWAFLESRGMMPEAHPRFKLSRETTAQFEAALRLAEGSPGADLWIPCADIGQELLDAGLVARTIHSNGKVTYRLTPAGKAWRG